MQLSKTSQYVKECFEDCVNGNSTAYLELVRKLHDCNEMDELRDLLTAMAQWASIIGQHHARFSELLVLLFAFDWEIDDEKTMTAFEDVIVSLVSSNNGFVEEAFRLLVRNFIRSSFEDDEMESSAENEPSTLNSSQEDEQASRRKTVMNHLHGTIHRILRICPLGCGTLLNIIIDCFPKQQQDVQAQTEFAREALRVGDQVPVLQDRLIRMAIKSLLELDLELTSAINESKSSSTPFVMEDVEDEQESRKKLRLTAAEQEMAEKVDSMLCILFDYFDEHVAKKRPTQGLFRSVLDSFEKEVLRTGRAKFSQYFIFYVCSAKVSYVDQFVNLLMDRLSDEKENILVRENATKFLGSFLARAKYVSAKTIKQCLQRLNDWLKKELPSVKSSRIKKKRSLFNSAFQSMVYVIIFRGSTIGGGLSFIENELPGWQEMCDSGSYRPLERISRDILDEFNAYLRRERQEQGSKVGKLDQIASDATTHPGKLERSDDIDEAEPAPQVTTVQAPMIVMEFPFDPLVLERAAKRIEPHYQEWYSSESQLDEEEEEEDSSEDEEMEEDTIILNASVLNETLPKPIRIERIRRMLGGAWMLRGDQDRGIAGELQFPSPALRPASSQVPGLLLGGSQPVPSTAAVSMAKAIPPARQRTLSTMSTESGQCGSW